MIAVPEKNSLPREDMHNGTQTQPESAADHLRQSAEELKSKAEACTQQTKQFITENPTTSLLIGLGVGLGFGLLLGSAGPRRQPSSWASRSWGSVEGFGHQVADSISRAIPDAVTKYFES